MEPTVSEIQGSGTGDEDSTHPLNNPPSLTITTHTGDNTTPSVQVDSTQKSLRTSPTEFYGASKSPPSNIPSLLKNSPKGRGTGFNKQEILFLAKAFIRVSTDPIIGTSQKENQFFQRICDVYNQQIATYNEQNASVEKFIPLTTRTKHSLKGHLNRCLQPAVQKFVGIESRYKMKSGKNIENHLGKLMTIYEEEMKENKSGAPKEFSKYLDAFLWLKGEPKFGTHFLKWRESVPDDISVGGDWSTSGFDSDFGISNENNKRPRIGRDRAKKNRKNENLKPEEKKTTLLDQQAAMLEKGVEQLNKQTEMFLKQQNEGMNNFFELEAMKYASESDRNEYF